MRKALFIIFSVLLVVSLAFIPTNIISAKSDTESQVSAPSPAQTAEEEAIIQDILEELEELNKKPPNK